MHRWVAETHRHWATCSWHYFVMRVMEIPHTLLTTSPPLLPLDCASQWTQPAAILRGPYQLIQVQLHSATTTVPTGTSITLTLNSSVSVAGSTSDSCPSTAEEFQRISLHLTSPGSGPNKQLPKSIFTSNSINLCSGNNPVQFLSSCNSRNFPY